MVKHLAVTAINRLFTALNEKLFELHCKGQPLLPPLAAVSVGNQGVSLMCMLC